MFIMKGVRYLSRAPSEVPLKAESLPTNLTAKRKCLWQRFCLTSVACASAVLTVPLNTIVYHNIQKKYHNSLGIGHVHTVFYVKSLCYALACLYNLQLFSFSCILNFSLRETGQHISQSWLMTHLMIIFLDKWQRLNKKC